MPSVGPLRPEGSASLSKNQRAAAAEGSAGGRKHAGRRPRIAGVESPLPACLYRHARRVRCHRGDFFSRSPRPAGELGRRPRQFQVTKFSIRLAPLALQFFARLAVSWNVNLTPAPSPTFYLLLIVHAHQPAGNFEHVFEECYRTSYDPFLAMVERHKPLRLAVHYSGPLLLWLEKNHPEYFARLRALVASKRIELIGGGFYEPILVSIPTV